MAVTLAGEVIDMIQGDSAVDRACKLALMASLGYHFTCQVGEQKDVLTCLCAFAACNIFHLATALKLSFSEICVTSCIFNSLFVPRISRLG